jgi:transcriptional regulator with XRE-family HTH domain
MNTQKLQELKMAWLAAKEAGDTQAQYALLRDHPDAQDALIDFIAAYHATGGTEQTGSTHQMILPVTQRAFQIALGHIFAKSAAPTPVTVANLRDLRAARGLSLVNAAKGLRLGIDVWKKFEDGAIELMSLSERQLERLARFFQVSSEQFGSLLNNSQPQAVLNRRQKSQTPADYQHGAKKQSFAEAIKKSTMPREEKQEWLEE